MDRKKLAEAYFDADRIAEHHIDSFNNFLEHGMQRVVDEQETIDTDIGEKEGEEEVYVRLGRVEVGKPVSRRRTEARSLFIHRRRAS